MGPPYKLAGHIKHQTNSACCDLAAPWRLILLQAAIFKPCTAGCRSTWQLEGQVTGASDNNMDMGRKTHGGQEWDYVFDVDVEEGQPPLKMPCNKDENPYAVAER